MSMAKDPVCGRMINEQQSVGKRPYEGQTYYFCQTICRELFEQNPRHYVSPPAVIQRRCPMFVDRADAGRQLAASLHAYRNATDALVLAIPRGGVVVGYYLAKALNLPLDLIVARKIGAPSNPELAIGAVVTNDHQGFFNERLIGLLGVPAAYIEAEVGRQLKEIERRYWTYRGEPHPPRVEGQRVLLTDDGIATGYTTRAALAALRRGRPKELVLAVPVAPAEAVAELQPLVDKMVCLYAPDSFGGVGAWYEDFHQVSDEEVKAFLQAAKAEQAMESSQA